MRKTIILLVMVTTLSTYVSCTDKSIDNKYPDKRIDIVSSYEGLISNIRYDNNTKKLTFLITNNTKSDIYFGAEFKIEEYKGNGVWEESKLTKDLIFIEIAYGVLVGETIEEYIDFSLLGEDLPEGIYRVKRIYYNESEKINGYIEFDVDDMGRLSNFTTYNMIIQA